MTNIKSTDIDKNDNKDNNENELFSLNTLLRAGLNFGGETKYWNPRMKPYIYTKKIIKDTYSFRTKKIYILNSMKIKEYLNIAYEFLYKLSSENKSILIVGTSSIFLSNLIEKEAERGQIFYINHKWQGGTLTNLKTIRSQVRNMILIEKHEVDGTLEKLSKNERIKIRKHYYKLKNKLNGIKKMTSVPSCVIVLDAKNDTIAIQEANKLSIPVIAVVNTNCDPENISYVIPGNNVSRKSQTFFVKILIDAIVSGKKIDKPEIAYKENLDFNAVFDLVNSEINDDISKSTNTNSEEPNNSEEKNNNDEDIKSTSTLRKEEDSVKEIDAEPINNTKKEDINE